MHIEFRATRKFAGKRQKSVKMQPAILTSCTYQQEKKV